MLAPPPFMMAALSAFGLVGHMTLAGLASQAQEWSSSVRQRILRENLSHERTCLTTLTYSQAHRPPLTQSRRKGTSDALRII